MNKPLKTNCLIFVTLYTWFNTSYNSVKILQEQDEKTIY